MKAFMDENFLLPNHAAERLYHEYAKDMPAGQVAGDIKFDNMGTFISNIAKRGE